MFYTEAGHDDDIPYLVVCEGAGEIMSYNLISGGTAAAHGLGGVVVSAADAEKLRTHVWRGY